MIYFVTSNTELLKYYHEKAFPNILVLDDTDETFKLYGDFIINKTSICLDKETNGLDAYVNSTILDVIGDEEHQFVLHAPYCNTQRYFEIIKDLLIIGHNIKFDLKFVHTENNLLLRQVYDTMIAEQRIYMKSGLFFALAELFVRYLDRYPSNSDKVIREEFIGVDVLKFKILPRHIYYAVGDIEHLPKIKSKQEEKIELYKLRFLLYHIEFPLISIIGKAENEGWEFDKDRWMALYHSNVKKRFELELKMDEEVRRLRDLKLKNSPDRVYMLGGKWDNVRKHNPEYDLFNTDGTTNTLNLFGEPMKVNTLIGSKAKQQKKIKANPNNINYESDTQIIELFGRLKEPVLTKGEVLMIPTFKKNGKINKDSHSFTTSETAFVVYKNMMPNSVMMPFIDMLIEHRGLSNAINTFGANFINKINPKTNRLHTIFKQVLVTGRMSSGGGRKEPDKYNAQNIPKNKEMRNCFIAPKGYSIGTHDYSGAELIVMCSLSQDMKLLEISKKDIHSYVAQACWRNIYKYKAHQLINSHEQLRARNGMNYKDEKMVAKINEYINLSNVYIVDKETENGSIRQSFKPMTFGTIYGMYASKAGKTLRISKEEGQMVINTIKGLFPKVFKMVENAANRASANGYVVLNQRTNSRAWFPNVIKAIKGYINRQDNFRIISAEINEARNIRIQGTQADAIKEASVELQKWIDKNNLQDKIIILKWVHDEIVDKHPNYLNGISSEWKEWIKLNPYGLRYEKDDGTVMTGLSFPEVKKLLMIDVFNRYLDNVTIDVDYHVMPYWTK